MVIKTQYGSGSSKDIIMIIAFLFGIIIVFYMLAKREIGSLGESLAGTIPKFELPSVSLFGEKTDLQTIDELMKRDYDIKYVELSPDIRAEFQKNLGTTKSYYELYGSRMTWDAFQEEIGGETGGYGSGFDGTTTILRSEVPVGYTGEYWAGKRIV